MKLIPATAEHIEAIVADIPERSAIELAELFDSTPVDALRFSLASSTGAWTIVDDAGAVAMFGATPSSVLDSLGIVWFIGTRGICRNRLAFAKATRRFVRVLFEQYSTLENIIDHRHEDVVKWVRWLGAEVAPLDGISSVMTLRRPA